MVSRERDLNVNIRSLVKIISLSDFNFVYIGTP